MRRRLGGTEGNARLTATTAVILLVLLAAEGETIPFLNGQLTLHILLGFALIPPVLLKLGSTGWRFVQYYRGRNDYVAKGPPHQLMRLVVAPLTVASTAALFGTGVFLVLPKAQRGLVLGLHKASFIVWVAAMSAHVLWHLIRLPALARADLERPLPGATLRQFLVAGALVAGVVVAIAVVPPAHSWEHLMHLGHHDG